MKIEVEVDVDDSHELLELIAEFKEKKEKEKKQRKSIEELFDKFKNVVDDLQAEEYCLHNHRDLTEEERNRYKTTIAELEEKESELAKEIAYKIYRDEAIILDKYYEPF
jgi:chromosome segregation ATPase